MTSGSLALQNMQLSVSPFLGTCGSALSTGYSSGTAPLLHAVFGIALARGFSSTAAASLAFMCDVTALYLITPLYPAASRSISVLVPVNTILSIHVYQRRVNASTVTVEVFYGAGPSIVSLYQLAMNFTTNGSFVNHSSNVTTLWVRPTTGVQCVATVFIPTALGAKMVIGMASGVGTYCCVDAAYAVDPLYPTQSAVMTATKSVRATATGSVSGTATVTASARITKSGTSVTSPTPAALQAATAPNV